MSAVAAEPEWSDPVAVALATVIGVLFERADLARLYLLEAAAVGEGMAARPDASAERLIAILEPGREVVGTAPAEGIEEALVGGVITLLARRVLAGEAEHLARFLPAAIESMLGPYLGPEEARAVAAHPADPS